MTMADYLSYFLFVLSIVYSPGPMTLFMMANGIKMNYQQIFPILLGANHAYLFSIIVFSCGLASVFREYDLVLKVVQVIGIIYLCYLAYKQWTKNNDPEDKLHIQASMKKSTLYMKGAMIALSNPKTILLFSIIFPQFTVENQNYYWQVAVLGGTFLLLQFSSGCFYAYFGKYVKHYLNKPHHLRLINHISAAILLMVAGFLIYKF